MHLRKRYRISKRVRKTNRKIYRKRLHMAIDFFFNFLVFCCFAGFFCCFFCLFAVFFFNFFVVFLFLCVRLFVFGSFILVGFFIRSLRMVADSRHREKNVQNREKTFIIKKKLEKNFRIQKNISGSKTKLWNLEKKSKSRKIFRNREKYFRIEKTISKSRKMFKNREIFCYKSRQKTLNSIISNSSYVPS